MSSILLVGPGPTGGLYHTMAGTWRGMPVATVNGGIDLVPDPDYYAVVEHPAIHQYKEHIERLQQNRKTTIFTSQSSAETFQKLSAYPNGMIMMPHYCGKNELTDIMRDRPYPQEEGGETWMSVGVFMLWCLAHVVRPRRICVLGLDGYQYNNRYDLNIKHRPPRKPQVFYERMNQHMSDAISIITNWYTRTQFIWLEKPVHYQESWAVVPDWE